MAEIIHNLQFKKIEKRLGTIITVPEKVQFKIWEYPKILEITRIEAACREMTPQEWLRWINLKQLASLGRLGSIEIEDYKPRYCTDEELEIKKKIIDPFKLHRQRKSFK